jgi:uncharacterized membrane protein HdeD (DUF308 family)
MAEPDAFENRVRFVCGLVFGVGSGLVAATRWPFASALFLVLFVGGYAVVCGLLAMRWGDRFWTSLRWW